jgi:gamma-glutamyltranspeptidase/glutathione hydrolase
MGTGSPGGATIIQYVIKTLVGVLDWGMDARQATSMVFRRGQQRHHQRRR